MEKRTKIIIYSSLILLLLIPSYFIFFNNKSSFICNDGTGYNECSKIQPYLCLNGTLTESVSICGCSNNSEIFLDVCTNDYKTNPRKITLHYTLNSKKKELNFTLYQGLYDYLSDLPRYINTKKNTTLLDFKLISLDEKNQREFLLPLVVAIQNSAENKDDQARIAISIVQNIPFGSSNKTFRIGQFELEYYRYPYEVLYENQGVCGEKSELLAFLLRELGYGSAFLYYYKENHEAMGIKCPAEKGIDGIGYCFIETTGPSIINDNEIEYVTFGKLDSEPEIIPISGELSFGQKNFYEYKDAKTLNKIREQTRKYGVINFIQNFQFQSLKKKYGLLTYEYIF